MIRYPHPESNVLEFKAGVPKNDKIVRTVVGFCNMHGGHLLIGVSDEGEVVGVDEGEVEHLLEYLHKAIYEQTSPPIIADIHTRRFGEKLVLVVGVSPGGGKPYCVRSLGIQKGTFIRMGRSTVRADAATIEDLSRQARGISYDSLPFFSATIADLDRERIRRFLSQRTVGFDGIVSDRLLQNYRLAASEHGQIHPTAGGLLLFSADPAQWFPEACFVCTRFKGVEGRDALASLECRGPLMEQFEQALHFVSTWLEKGFTITATRRIETSSVPPVALREIILNAVVHRNYALSSPSKIAVYDNRIEVFSPGVFPGPIDIADITAGVTYIRNTAIARVLREAGYIEKLGSGFIVTFDAYRKAGLRPPHIVEGAAFVKVILPREAAAPALEPALDDVISLFCRFPALGVGDVMRETGVSRATASRRLRELERTGRARRTGKGPATRYVPV